ncbi:MAG: glutathione S-transferase family protein [Myxococcota bacterium]|nr:glutathione S-transferase family protein [Myxococcota bacterium]
MLRLYYHPVPAHCRKALVAVYYRGDEVAFDLVDVFGELSSSDFFQALSPFGGAPVLDSPDGPIFESTSIIEYLESRGPARLIPDDPQQARLARHFDRLADRYLLPNLRYFGHEESGLEQRDFESLVETAWQVVAEQLRDGRPFLAGHAFSLGDLGLAIATDDCVRIGMSPPRIVDEWLWRCFELGAMSRALEEALPFAPAHTGTSTDDMEL